MADKKAPTSKQENHKLVVGLGASAGGLNALKSFFDSLPEDTGMAFIVIVHLSPEHESNMAELLQTHTSLKVLQVTQKVKIKPDHVYVIPPGKLLSIRDDHLELAEPDRKHGLATIDLFFRSLAKRKGKHTASVILSGTGNDGTIGLKAIKEGGGLTIVQDPGEAEYVGMPQNAIDSGLADLILPVKKIAEELLNYKKSLSQISISEDEDGDKKILQKIFARIRSQIGHDFSDYKRSSVLRRIERRMQVNRVKNLSDYFSYLKNHPKETDELFKDLLISVTNFFRDEEAFEALENTIIPKLFEDKEPKEKIRVWVPGCATGEEAYSIAMLLYEYAQRLDLPPDLQIFASDIDEFALNTARKARYPQSIIADISSERLNRFFNKDGIEYEVKKEIREMILFASHDLLRDPPFSKQDLIACRNLLIYLNRQLQSEVFNLFHYTLRAEGYLFIGLSDSNLEASDLFTPIDKKNRLYQRTVSSNSNLRLPHAPLLFSGNQQSSTSYPRQRSSHKKSNFETLHQNLLTRLYAPQSVIINENFQVIHATDGIKKFLEYSGGEPSHNLLEMVKPEIRQPLRTLLLQAERKDARLLHKKIRLTDTDQIDMMVHYISEAGFSDGLIHVVFKELQDFNKAATPAGTKNKEKQPGEEDDIIRTLEDELEYTREQLQITIEEYETSNEELRASNEELQSMNEELQSTTEELETSQEELQSVNEELKTVNQELENQVENLNRATSDLKNLMEATEVGIIFVDRNFCVQRFTSPTTKIFNLIPTDKGRPLEHVTHHLAYDHILDDIKHVHVSLGKIKKVVTSKDGHWYIMRMRPYRSTEDKIEGVVLTFVEFTELKEAREIAENKDKQEAMATLGMYALEQSDLQAILKRAIDLSCIILNLECAVILAYNEQSKSIEIAAHAGCAAEKGPITINDEWDIGYALKNEEPTIVKSYKEDDRFIISPFFKDKDIESSVHIVVRGSKKSYGLLGFYSKEEYGFTEDKLNFLRVVANMVGSAMERNRTKTVLEEKNTQLQNEMNRSQQFQREILNNSIVERWELGGYLHDNLAQMLVSVKLMVDDLNKKLSDDKIDMSKEITDINEIIDEGILDIRDLTHDIIPIDIEEEGITHAFHLLIQHTQKMYGVKCTLEIEEVVNEINNLELTTHLYHIIQEAIKNAAVHGQANNIKVSITKSNENLTLQVEDNGIGMPNASNDHNGKGIRIMKHRMELMGGTFTIEGISGSDETGTLVTCTLPLKYLT